MIQEPTRTPPGFGVRRSSAALAALAWSAAWILVDATPASAAAQRPASTGLYKDRITPHWFHQSTRFWYRNDLRDGAREFIVVDAARGTREPAFDPARLTASLALASGLEVLTDRLPFDRIEFVRDGKAFRFNTAETAWECDLDTYQCTRTDAGPAPEDADNPDARSRARGERGRRAANGTASRDSARSPDGRLEAVIRDHNVYVRTLDSNEPDIPLTKDGRDGLGYGWPSWSPDSSTLIAFRIEPAERKEVFLIESSPRDGGRAVLHRRPYALPGDPFTTYELNLFNVADRRQIRPEVERFEHEWLRPRPRWIQDGRRLAYEQTDRGHQRFRVIEVDRQTSAVRNLVDETSQTFIWTAHTENLRLDHVNWLDQTEELILVSERDGWRHLYLVDTRDGNVKTQITQGPWVVRGIDRIDEPNRQIWFHAGGRNPDQDPYLLHFYRVGFDGTGLVALTEGDGNHSLQFSPDRRHAIDTYSSVDRPPVHELRRTSDGGLVCKFEEADISELREGGWEPPEVFVAKGRDATTDIWGIICRPRPFDPSRKYPVIEDVYAGPQGSFVPKNFSRTSRYESLLNRGFIVVKVDGMGTANRSKAFHDVCWKNLKDAGFPDRILWHQAAAAKYPHYDLDRLGIYGNSAGGQNAAAAVLFHPEFYKVAVASCGCHDNRLDKASWNEQWMGYPVGPQYSESSNIDNAHRLRGKLFLIVGELDRNVPPESTLRFADALVRAGKDFELLVIPGGGHGLGGAYGQRRMEDFFVRHLLGQEPPDRNGASTPRLDD